MISVRIYRALLRLAPRDLRDRRGHQMVELFESEVFAARQQNRAAAFRVASRGLVDLLLRIPYEWSRRVRRRHPLHARPVQILEAIDSDVRFGLRSLSRRPVFAVVAVGTIALSIGAATAMYSI